MGTRSETLREFINEQKECSEGNTVCEILGSQSDDGNLKLSVTSGCVALIDCPGYFEGSQAIAFVFIWICFNVDTILLK